MSLDSSKWFRNFCAKADAIMSEVYREKNHGEYLEMRTKLIFNHPRWGQMPVWVQRSVVERMHGWEAAWRRSGEIVWMHWWVEAERWIEPDRMDERHVAYANDERMRPFIRTSSVTAQGGHIDTSRSAHVWAPQHFSLDGYAAERVRVWGVGMPEIYKKASEERG